MGNTLRTLGLFALMIALFSTVGWLVGGFFASTPLLGMGIFLVLAVVLNLASYFWSDRIVLWSYHARIVTEAEAPRLHRIVRDLALRADLPMPRLAIVPTDAPNAFATGRNPQHAVVAATRGLLRLLDDDELRGVLAHEMSHVRHRDTLIMSAAATLAGAIAFAARSAIWSVFLGGGRGRDDNLVTMVLLAVLAPVAALLVQAAISRSREFKADAGAAELTGRPLDLARALQRLEAGGRQGPLAGGDPSSAHLFIVNPLRGGGLTSLFRTHPPTAHRVKALEEHARSLGQPVRGSQATMA